jgi:sporulation protein YlmC with PRC-barrel domain
MKLKLNVLVGALLVVGASLSAWAQPEPSHERFGVEKTIHDISRIQIKNFQDEDLGSVVDLGIDFVNGRIVEVLVATDSSLGVGEKIVAVPPHALFHDPLGDVYRLNLSTDEFKNATAIDLSKWTDAGRSDRVAAAYYYFAQEPYFEVGGNTTNNKNPNRPKVPLGYVERSSKILEMPVGNLQNQHFGTVYSMSLDIPKGRILSVVVLAPGNFKTKSIIPAMALRFNEARDGLVLDESKVAYADEPRYVFTEAQFGNEAMSEEESYEGPHTSVALEQGRSYRDIDRTVLINKGIRAANINHRNVQVGTINGRTTLRGWVDTEDDKRRIGEIAIAASHLEVVDNQITVGKPVTAN